MSQRMWNEISALKAAVADLTLRLDALEPPLEPEDIGSEGPVYKVKHRGFGNWFVVDARTDTNINGSALSKAEAEALLEEMPCIHPGPTPFDGVLMHAGGDVPD